MCELMRVKLDEKWWGKKFGAPPFFFFDDDVDDIDDNVDNKVDENVDDKGPPPKKKYVLKIIRIVWNGENFDQKFRFFFPYDDGSVRLL